jgi:hypothetical protein
MASEYRTAFDAQNARWKALVSADIPSLNRQLAAAGLPTIRIRQ